MSSSTATDSTTRANRVPSRFRSAMIREITGMLVTAMASAKTSAKATRSSAPPMKRLAPSQLSTSARPARKGSTLPMREMAATGRPSARDMIERSCVPEQYIRRMRPSW